MIIMMLPTLLLTGCGTGALLEPIPEPETTAAVTETTVMTTETTAAPVLPDADLREMISGMSVREKAAQMLLACCHGTEQSYAAAEAGVGGICLFAKDFEGKSRSQVRDMTAEMQLRAAIPLLLSADEEGGYINRISINPQLRETPFKLGRTLYAEGGWERVRADTKEKAALLLDLGINVNLAPVCDVPLSESNYIYNRCFSLDAQKTARYIRVVVTEMKKDGLGSSLKHFPGYGGSADTHKGMGYDDRDYSAFTESDFLPFQAGIQSGADSVMVSHNIVRCMDSEHPASLSPEVHRILREELHFGGVIVSDDLDMDAITEFTGGENPAVAAVLAGNDLICYAKYEDSIAAITAAVQSGTVRETQLDESVLRILKWKRALGVI